ncbi:MAG: hypothetical protein LBH26_05090, partial [Treponema sp.]|nr:hypothetical protein [Treponema sp.]
MKNKLALFFTPGEIRYRFARILGFLLCCASLALCPGAVSAQAIRESVTGGAAQSLSRSAGRETELPLRRMALCSSGVGFFEHAGTVNGSAAAPVQFNLPFHVSAVNDALKSLIINDPSPGALTVRYASSETLNRALKSLRIDLSGDPGIGE